MNAVTAMLMDSDSEDSEIFDISNAKVFKFCYKLYILIYYVLEKKINPFIINVFRRLAAQIVQIV